MYHPHLPRSSRLSDPAMAKYLALGYALSLLAMGFLCDPPAVIWQGLVAYITSADILITDYFVIGSIGAAFANAGIVTLIAVGITVLLGVPYKGGTLSMIFLMSGFAFFGKNPLNILPFFLGTFLYSFLRKQKMARFANAAFFSTTLCPMVSGMWISSPFPFPLRILAGIAVGTAIGYIIIPLAEHSFSTHMGYNLFNYGFAGGLLALVIASLLQAMGYSIQPVLIWQDGVPPMVLGYLLTLIVSLILLGFYDNGWHLHSYLRIMRHSGRAPTDFMITDGIGPTMVNMGTVGLVSLLYILAIGGDLNGPVLGAILTSIGFAAAGQHPKNITPVMLGVFLASQAMTHSSDLPGMQLAALFGAALAPIAGQFGLLYGVMAGFLHAGLVLALAAPCGGYNLYNNGFSAGVVALVMVSIIQGLSAHRRDADR